MLEQTASMASGDHKNTSRLEMSCHMGTHVDAPHHFLDNGKTIESLPLSTLSGRAYVLHLPDVDLITADLLERSEIPPRTRRILFKTRNSDFWAKGERAFQTGFVALSEDAARYLVNRGVKLVGVDYLSVAPYQQSRLIHEILLGAGVVIVEGLDLSSVTQGRYTLYCLPLKIVGADGAPTRAILIGV
ncbi:MAG: cyclase family protein [Anaerolineales bacterium]|nr:cyclase family protein [Anaerolineales bacterium]